MTIKLNNLELPEELVWIDEFAWNPIRMQEKVTLSGVRNIFESSLNSEAGRLITLTSDDAWIERQDLNTLFSWTKELNKIMEIIMHDDIVYNVRFRHLDPPVIEYEPIVNTAFVDNYTLYRLTIKLEIL